MTCEGAGMTGMGVGMTCEGVGMTESPTCCGPGAIHAAKVNGNAQWEIPAYAGMTCEGAGMTCEGVGYDVGGCGI